MEACVCICREDGPDCNDSSYKDFDPKYPDGEELYFVKTTTEPTEKSCTECGCPIPPGQSHEKVKARYEGEWHVFHTCTPCLNVRKDLFRCGWTHGQMWEDLCETWCEQLLSEDLSDDEYEQACEDIWDICHG